MKKRLTLVTISLPFLASAQEPVESCQLPVGYFYPGLYDFGDCCTEVSVSGQFLYWEVNYDSVAQIGTGIRTVGNTTNLLLLSHDQGYRPGFKVSLGLGFPQNDHWNFDVEYTWLHKTSTKRFNASPDEVIITKRIPAFYPIFSSSLRSVQKFNLNFLHAVGGRPMYLSQRIVVKPFIGIKAWWASQGSDFYFDLIGGLPQGTQFTKTHIWGIGPYIGSDVQALLWCGTYVKGRAGIWPTYTRQNKYRVVTNYPAVPAVGFPGINNTEINHNFPFESQIMYDGGAWIGWGTYFCDSYHLDLCVGWEIMTNYILAQLASSGSPVSSFYYQGLSVKAQFDF
ncbi:MAG: hypothetical protein JSS30_03120 [Verrucomicrobia bacterium]|nr:hypothetical protein [Verrucomicrobiota bacterium]